MIKLATIVLVAVLGLAGCSGKTVPQVTAPAPSTPAACAHIEEIEEHLAHLASFAEESLSSPFIHDGSEARDLAATFRADAITIQEGDMTTEPLNELADSLDNWANVSEETYDGSSMKAITQHIKAVATASRQVSKTTGSAAAASAEVSALCPA